MAKKHTKKDVSRVPTSRALVLHAVSLTPAQTQGVGLATPDMFVKSRTVRGNKIAAYVETGYVVSRLNQIFSPAGWDFEILEQGVIETRKIESGDGEVWVRGRLTILDHKNGYRVSKTQYGQHVVHKNIPVGDALKAAASDCLKKCASLFGIAHDIYWKISNVEGESKHQKEQTPQKRTKMTDQDMQKVLNIIKSSRSIDALQQIEGKVKSSPIYTPAQKKEVFKAVGARYDALDV